MSKLPDSDFDLDKLFLPAWAQEDPSAAKYSKFEGEDERPDRRDRRGGRRPPRREPGGVPGAGRPRGEFRRRPGGDGAAPSARGPRPRTGRPERESHGRGRGPRPERLEHREPPPPLPEVAVTLIPEEKGVESLARQIKMSGRAYPLFEIAQMILQKPERHAVLFTIKKNAEGKPVQPLFVCALDDTLWLSEDEAIGHVLKKHFATFYQADRTATEPPKGKYTFVAQCGMSGVTLGPPNYHDYQNQLRKLHSERFSRMPFEVYKSRVKIVRDEEVVKKWVEDQSWKTEYVCLNLPEPVRLSSMEAVEKHFRETHKENIIKPVESHTLGGGAARNLRSPGLVRLVRSVTEDQRRFPLQIATVLSQQFASHGLQFFKVNKTITHVAVARPHYLDMELTPVSEGVKRIVDFINAHPRTNRRQLIETLAPTPPAREIPVSPPPAEPSPATNSGPAAPPAAAPQPEPPGPTPEQTAVIADLHWLIHQGHVIEFATGILETAKKPAPRPPKPEQKPKPDETPAGETLAAEGAPPPTEAVPGQTDVCENAAGQASSAIPAASESEMAAPQQAGGPTPETPTPETPAIPPESPLMSSPENVANEPKSNEPLAEPNPAQLDPSATPVQSPS